LVAFTSATTEQTKEADQIGIKMYAWNDFLKVVGTLVVGCLQFNLLTNIYTNLFRFQSRFCSDVMFTMVIFVTK
jgi:hypothetical protein